jgi:hypothetical protein
MAKFLTLGKWLAIWSWWTILLEHRIVRSSRIRDALGRTAMGHIVFHPSVETEILIAATALWRAGGNGDRYKCFLSAGDYERLTSEFSEPIKVLTFTRFTVEISQRRMRHSLMSGNVHRVDLKLPPGPVELTLVPKT